MAVPAADTPGEVRALCLHAGDDVAVLTGDGPAGARCRILGPGTEVTLSLTEAVPFGHKVALRDLAPGDVVRKYGQPIGLATRAIAAGSHVHVHNLGSGRASLRGQPDA